MEPPLNVLGTPLMSCSHDLESTHAKALEIVPLEELMALAIAPEA